MVLEPFRCARTHPFIAQLFPVPLCRAESVLHPCAIDVIELATDNAIVDVSDITLHKIVRHLTLG